MGRIYPIGAAQRQQLHITYYDIILEDKRLTEDGEYLNPLISSGAFTEADLFTYDAHFLLDRSTYIARRVQAPQLSQSQIVILGDGSEENGIRNGPLRSDGVYLIWMSAYTEISTDYTDRSFMQTPVRIFPESGRVRGLTDSTLSSGDIAAIFFGLLFLLLLIIMIVLCYRNREEVKNRLREYKETGFKATMTSGVDTVRNFLIRHNRRTRKPPKHSPFIGGGGGDGPVSSYKTSTPKKYSATSFTTESVSDNIFGTGDTGLPPIIAVDGFGARKGHSRPIPVTQLAAFVQQKDYAPQMLAQEFKQLPYDVQETQHIAKKPANKARNRFLKTIAFDKNRIKLPRSDGATDNNDNYINASLVKSHTHQFYIVTQSPLQHTINAFWLMVWHRNVDCIVMLLSLNEYQQTYEQYWPMKDQGRKLYGNIYVETILETST